MEKNEKIRQFIMDMLVEDIEDIADDEELLVSGLLDSIAIAQLVVFIENELSVSVPAADLRIENFQTISKIVNYLDA